MIRYLWIILLMGAFCAHGQDPQYSQFYSNPLELNPAFTGATEQYRAVANYRNQWPELPKSFVTYSASFDAYVSEINSGFGLKVTHDNAGSGALKFTNISGLFAYEFKLFKKVVVKPGLQMSVYQRGVDKSKLTFGDQLIRGSGRSSVETLQDGNQTYFDFSSGVLIFSENFWLGFSGHHLNEPNESLLDENAPLPARYSLHAGGRLVLKKSRKGKVERALWGAVNIKEQNESRTIDIGAYGEYYPLLFGVWYRGIEWGKNQSPSYQNRDAIVAMVGVEWMQMRFGYSYDITISNLAGYSGGSHEISVVVEFVDHRPKKHKIRYIPCPSM